MSRRSWLVLIVVVSAACVAAALLVWRPWDAAPAIETGALGVWQEQTTDDPLRVTVSAADDGDDGVTQYWVSVRPASSSPGLGRLDGDVIVVLAANGQDVAWRVTYDSGADALLLTLPDGSQRHILRRVSR